MFFLGDQSSAYDSSDANSVGTHPAKCLSIRVFSCHASNLGCIIAYFWVNGWGTFGEPRKPPANSRFSLSRSQPWLYYSILSGEYAKVVSGYDQERPRGGPRKVPVHSSLDRFARNAPCADNQTQNGEVARSSGIAARVLGDFGNVNGKPAGTHPAKCPPIRVFRFFAPFPRYPFTAAAIHSNAGLGPVDPRDQVVHPDNRLVSRRKDGQCHCLRRVSAIPSCSFNHLRRPSVHLAIGEKSTADLGCLPLVDRLVRKHQLKID